jgi:hypothetical protein
MRRRLIALLGWLLRWPLALLILFEEWGWEPLQRALVRLSERLHLRWLEPRIRSLPPYAALALFAVPALLLLPVKLLALAAIGKGHVVMGAVLMRLGWFASGYARWTAWKERLLAEVRRTSAWRQSRVLRRRVARRVATLRRAFRAAP